MPKSPLSSRTSRSTAKPSAMRAVAMSVRSSVVAKGRVQSPPSSRPWSVANSSPASTIVATESASASPRTPSGPTKTAASTKFKSIAPTAKATGVRVSPRA